MSKHLSILTHLRLYALRLATRRRRRHLHSPVRAAGLPRRLSCQCLASSGSLLLHLSPLVSCCLSLPARIEDGLGQGAVSRRSCKRKLARLQRWLRSGTLPYTLSQALPDNAISFVAALWV